MKLVWKLLRQHISFAQLAGFFLANLFGMTIVLLSLQFYKDVVPIFTGKESLLKNDYMIVTKKVSTLGSLLGRSNAFSNAEIEEIKRQPFAVRVGAFVPTRFKVSAGMGLAQAGLHLSTEMFFESVPDHFVDVSSDKWHFQEGQTTVPIILPRNYLDLYNFGFAQARSLPKLSEGLMGMIRLDIHMQGNGREEEYTGNIVGFSNRLNTILVPESFMQWANRTFATGEAPDPSRLIVEVSNPADDRISTFFQNKGYEIANDKLDAGKTTYFLKMITGIVIAVGLVISLLSFYILMLSIYLLLQKNTVKLENLLLIGFSPAKVALPYQILTVGLNACVWFFALIFVVFIRRYYLDGILQLFPQWEAGGLQPAVLAGLTLFLLVCVLNIVAIRKKIFSIWMHK